MPPLVVLNYGLNNSFYFFLKIKNEFTIILNIFLNRMDKTKTTRTRKSTKYVFTLKNIITEKIDQKYGIMLVSNISNSVEQPVNSTTITDITEQKDSSLDIISFLDESKRLYQCNIF